MKLTVINNKILAIDFGERNVGLAITDAGANLVFGKGEIRGQKSLEGIFKAVADVVNEEDVVRVVFGVPESKDGVEVPQVERMQNIGNKLGLYLKKASPGVEVVFQDESFSSYEARSFIKDTGISGYGTKHSEHEVAAMIILNKYLLERELKNGE